jgi:hypothetical protein
MSTGVNGVTAATPVDEVASTMPLASAQTETALRSNFTNPPFVPETQPRTPKNLVPGGASAQVEQPASLVRPEARQARRVIEQSFCGVT